MRKIFSSPGSKNKLLRFRQSFYAFCADPFSFSVNFFSLKIDHEFSKGFNVGMADFVARLRSSAANFTDSRHMTYNMKHMTKNKNRENSVTCCMLHVPWPS